MKRVLFVDDEPEVLLGLQRTLRSMEGKWRMTFVSTGREALEALAREPFHAVVSDLRMPVMDGAQLLAEVKKRYPDTVRIVLTVSADRATIQKMRELAHEYLVKPCNAVMLMSVVHTHLALAHLAQTRAALANMPRPAAPKEPPPPAAEAPVPSWAQEEPRTFTDLNALIQHAISMTRGEWSDLAELVTELHPALPRVPCFVNELSRVLLNMIVNAAHAIADAPGEFGKPRGTIRIATSFTGGWAELRVSDTATVVSEEVRAQISQPRGDLATGPLPWLAMAYGVVVEKHGGQFEHQAQPGKPGATFIIRLPNPLGTAA